MIKEWIQSRFGEKTTWFALLAVITSFSALDLTDEQKLAIATFGSILVVAPERRAK
ncbi:hypothetical protein [Methylomonas koyamae]|uniref:hypothetical protein n=1 Tax=Methylomonas koyamae TaxID=702114 RepID=UPI000B006C38|nr:hypothetical protein [Methylomonas koyamae]BBL57018.1 hypothetical protein MKFW12EY_06310 [Methylomonas koyamae]